MSGDAVPGERDERGRDGPRVADNPSGLPSPSGLEPRELADALWLASEHPWLTVPSARRRPGGGNRGERDPHARPGAGGRPGAGEPHRAPADPRADGTGPEPGAQDAKPRAQEPDADGAGGGNGSRPAPGAGARKVSWLLPQSGERRPKGRAVGRALRPFRTAVPSAHTNELDEDATADRLALAPFLPPVLRPSPERRWRVILLVDTAPQMAVWRPAVARLTEATRRFGGFRDVTELALDASVARQAVVSLPGPYLGARRVSPRSLVDPAGRTAVLVLTDGTAPAWRSGAAQRLLALWGRRQPVAALHMLPQRLWHRTGLHPYLVRLRAAGGRAAQWRPGWEPAEAVSALLWSRSRPEDTVPVPVLEPHPSWLGPWSRFVAGDGPRELVLGAVLTGSAPAEPASVPRAATAFEKVAAFRGWASPEAFQLATRMAAVRLELSTMTEVQRRTLPGTRAEHMAEFLLAGLVSPVLWYDNGRCVYRFGPGVREELLAHGTRSATEQVIEQTAELLAPRSAAARDLLRYLKGERSFVVQADDADQDFRSVERSVLHALSGPHARRASALDAVEDGTVRHERSSGAATSVDAAPMAVQGAGDASDAEGEADGEEETARGNAAPGPSDTRQNDGGRPVRKPFVPGGKPYVPRPAVWGYVPPRNPRFTGRRELLDALETGLGSDPVAAVLPHALHGMGGVGKSQLALEYVYRHASEYDLVWWLPAEDETRMRAAFTDLAQRMGLTEHADTTRAVPLVLEALRTGQPFRRWLLVFDNAEDPSLVRPYLPNGPGSVIVTSRNPRWGALAHSVEVDVFTRQESVQLFRHSGPGTTEQEADRIAELLGDLPLAVEQASAWVAETGMSVDEYVEIFEQQRAEILEMSDPSASYPEAVARAWDISLNRLETSSPEALHLLRLCSFLAADPIPRSFLQQRGRQHVTAELDAVLGDPLRLGRALREINGYSLARIDYRADSVQLHRLVQTVLRNRMTPAEQELFRHAAHLLLADNLPGGPADPGRWPSFQALYPHVLASRAWESSDGFVRQLAYEMALFLFHWGAHDASLDFTERVYAHWRERFGEAEVQVLFLGQHLHQVLRSAGRHEDAARLTARMVAVLEEAGADEEGYLRVQRLAAGDLRARGDLGGALRLDTDIHARSAREFGDTDPFTLECASALAVSLRAGGDFARALEVSEETQSRAAEMYGDDHPLTLSALASVALDRLELGQYAQALSLSETHVERVRAVFGEDHPETALAVTRLAVVLRRAGRVAEAERNSDDALDALTRRFGAEHPDALRAAVNHAVDLRHAGWSRDSVLLSDRTLGVLEAVFGPRHPHTLCAVVNRAVTLLGLYEPDRAGPFLEQALAQLADTLGAGHPFTTLTEMNLAGVHFALGDPDRARSLDAQVLARLREHRGETHPLTLTAQANLATSLRALGLSDEAAELHRQAAERIEESLGAGHPQCLRAQAWGRANADLDPLYL
ncbi:FxSxx-COOH system tetratricopeptide repeat protein [Streptomyces cellostaticus]|uniref:FxSxx-COOH system tetratricopeptide repeat protein n=1 Tax=Streptomyces cellostaticus TaxID=67285 RepID=UPI0020274F95|nr:FxSxx-COOH system tetratricopeptide repeat protein [Streptomyces cellostaticus]